MVWRCCHCPSRRIGQVRFHTATDQQWNVAIARVGGLPIAVIDRARSAELMVDLAINRRNTELASLVVTSANGQVLSLCAQNPAVRRLFMQTDLIHADRMSLVFASRWFCETPLPERICTTDFFHDVALVGQARRARMFLLGGTTGVIDEAARRVQALYPNLDIVGHAAGYMRRKDEEARVVDAINAARPDILWIGSGFRSNRALQCAIAIDCAVSV